jgi:hypothetical protein
MQDVRERLRQRLEAEYGVDEAGILMDRPPGGWSDLVTNESLDQRLIALRSEFDAKLDALRFELVATMEREIRAQTWRLITAMAFFVTLMGGYFAVARP